MKSTGKQNGRQIKQSLSTFQLLESCAGIVSCRIVQEIASNIRYCHLGQLTSVGHLLNFVRKNWSMIVSYQMNKENTDTYLVNKFHKVPSKSQNICWAQVVSVRYLSIMTQLACNNVAVAAVSRNCGSLKWKRFSANNSLTSAKLT